MLLGDATSAWLAYDIISATEAPRQGLAILQYALLACALCALVGSAVMGCHRQVKPAASTVRGKRVWCVRKARLSRA
jgi:hypothetical protein